MNCEKENLNSFVEYITETKEQIIESDILLPEYYPEISKILKIDVLTEEEAVTVTEGKFSISGCVKIKLLYASEENNLFVFDNEKKYSRVITDKLITSDTCVIAKQSVNSVNYKAVGPKKLDIKVNLSVSAKCVNIEKNDIISSVSDDIECINVSKCANEPVCCCMCTVKLEEKPQNIVFNERNIKILKNECDINITEKRAIKNKIMLKGTCKVKVFYAGDENVTKNYDYSFPFTDVVEAYGLDENCIADLFIVNKDICVSINENDSSGYSADISVKMNILLKAYCKREITIISDCFSVDRETTVAYKKINITEAAKTDKIILDRIYDCEIYEDNIAKILHASIDNISISTVQSDNLRQINISAELNALYTDESGNIYTMNRKVSFEYELEENIDILSAGEIQDVTAIIVNEKVLRFSGKIIINTYNKDDSEINALSSIDVSENNIRNDNYDTVTLYYAQKGELVWNIAKNTGTRIKNIKENNDISDEEITEDRLLIFSNY